MLATAAATAKTPCAVCRVGQIAGPTTSKGMWPKQEWLPSIVLSSKYLGCLPSSFGPLERVDWIPVDRMAQVLLELCNSAAACGEGEVPVYHVVNPKKTSWTELLTCLTDRMGLPTKAFSEWVKELSESSADDLSRNPAMKLFGFFSVTAEQSGGQAELSTTASQKASQTWGSMGVVDAGCLGLWLQQWGL